MPAIKSNVSVESKKERDAIAVLSREFRPSLTRYFAKRIKETADIDDLVQEVFLRLAKRSVVTDVRSVNVYLFQTASSVYYDWLRHRRARRAGDHEEFVAETHGEVDFTPERVLMSKERLEQATAILMEMPERTRTIFVLRQIEGLRFKDISVRLDMPVSTIEKHMQRAIAYLAQRIGQE